MIPESQILAVECMEIAVEALQEVLQFVDAGDMDMVEARCVTALNEIKRKQALRV